MSAAATTTRQSANAMAKRFADDACRAKHESLQRAAHYLLWGIDALRDAGLPDNRELGSDVRTTLGTIIDALDDAAGLIEKAAEAEGIAPECFPLDLTELNDMHEGMGT